MDRILTLTRMHLCRMPITHVKFLPERLKLFSKRSSSRTSWAMYDPSWIEQEGSFDKMARSCEDQGGKFVSAVTTKIFSMGKQANRDRFESTLAPSISSCRR